VTALEPWLRLLQACGGESRSWRELLLARGSPEALMGSSGAALEAAGLSKRAIARLGQPDQAKLDAWRRWLDEPHRALITSDDPAYPRLLEALPDAPLALWVEGTMPESLDAPQVAIVGSRNPTRNGRDSAEGFARYLSERGVTITSGLAVGIDGAAHRGALQGVGGTVGVLGSGLDAVYPRQHQRLAREVSEHGLLVSEYGPGTPPRKLHFPQRNRIIAGLSLGTLVIEATRRSGSLITARLAAEYGREVLAMPGSIHNPLARGCHQLIRQGAALVEDAADVLIELAPMLELELATPAPSEESPGAMLEDPAYRTLLDCIGFEPTSVAQLASSAGLTPEELSSMLLVLELEGFVEALPGGRYTRLAKRGP
jgi:DNA processing protein